jgi:hypothetical protein
MKVHPSTFLVFDLEGDGLYHQCTKLHCAVTKDILTNEVKRYVFPQDLTEFLTNLTHYEYLCSHNGIDYDLPILQKLCGWKPKKHHKIVDTLVMSRLLNPDRVAVEGTRAPHSVEAWGKRLGRWKPDIEDWSVFTPEMLHRCAEDVEIQHMIFQTLCHEAGLKKNEWDIVNPESYSKNVPNWALSLKLEHKSSLIMRDQQENGVYFEKEKAVEHVNTLDVLINKLTSEITENIPPKPKQKGVTINAPFKKNGELTKAVIDWKKNARDIHGDLWDVSVAGPFSRIDWSYINLGSSVQLKEWLYSIGWEPDEWNYHKTDRTSDGDRVRTSPKVTETSLEYIPGEIGRKLSLRSKASHRRNQITGWIGNTRSDHRIQAEANPQGTPTGRMKHRSVANIPKADSDKETHELIWYPEKQNVFFGTEMRSLFSSGPDPDVVLVGRDASGLELRCFAHYINDPSYTDIILNGDIHTYHQEMAGLETRDMAKTFIYAFLYGAGDAKIGSIVLPNGSSEERRKVGADLKRQFLAANPKLAGLIKGVKKASRRGYLVGIDGRKLMMRTNERGQVAENKALNTLLQGAGAQIMTYARVWLYDKVKELKWDKECRKVLDYHDEETYESHISRAEDLRQVMVDSVRVSGDYYNLNIPLDASATVGRTWANIH